MKAKKIPTLLLLASLTLAACKYDDSELWEQVNQINQNTEELAAQAARLAALETWQKQTNQSIAAIQELLNTTDLITEVSAATEGGETVGYTISFLNSDPITLYNGNSYESVNREQLDRIRKGLDKEEEKVVFKDINSGVDLSGRGIKDTNNRIAQIQRSEERRKEEILNRNKRNDKGPVAKNSNPNSRNNNQQAKNKNPYNNPNRNNNPRGGNNYRNHRGNGSYSGTYSANRKKETGFIPVSQIADKEILTIKGRGKHSDEKE